jgi:hypothetical protein
MNRATQGTACKGGQDIPSISHPWASSEKVEYIFHCRPTAVASWGGGKAKAVAADLERENVVEGRKTYSTSTAACGRPTVARWLHT